MRFLFISNFYPPHDIGGYEKHCQEVADGLSERGHYVYVLTSRHGVGAAVQDGNIRRALHLESDLLHYSPAGFFLRRSHEERYNSDALRSSIADATPDAILVWGMWSLSRRVPAVAENSGIPTAYSLEDTWPLDADTHTRYWRSVASGRLGRLFMPWMSRLALRRLAAEGYPPALRYRHVACGSQFLQSKLAARIPAFKHARVVPCGVDLTMFAACRPHVHLSHPAAPRIIFVGGLGPHKGVHTAVEAVARLTQLSPGLQPRLTIVGGGHSGYEAYLRQLALVTGSADHIHFTGTVPKEAVPSLLAEHDILVVPSVVEEGFGRVVVEGMAAGLVVVGTATGGSAEILQDEVNGLIFSARRADALADCLLRLVHDPTLYARLAAAGKQTSARFDLQHMIDGIESFLLDVAAHDRPGMAI